MAGKGTPTTEQRLTLRSQLSELSRVYVWIEGLASQHAFTNDTQFAMRLCLEEVLSNIIRHGYSGQPDRSINVRFRNPREGCFVFVVEDEAPLFNPLNVPEPPPIKSVEEIPAGGRGIRLLRHFAQALEYQSTPTGNRLSIGFRIGGFGDTKD
jgi:serine/threonine-protein kinase RsbW